jgi:phage terminase large subunit-like protein
LSTALAEARDVDLLLIGTARGALASAGELRALARTAPAGEVESLQLIAVLVDRADTAARALDAGIELAERTGRDLVVFLSDEAMEAHLDLSRRLRSLGPKRAAVRTIPEPRALFAAVRRAAPAVLIVGTSETGFEEPKIGALQRELRCPMVVVRHMPA